MIALHRCIFRHILQHFFVNSVWKLLCTKIKSAVSEILNPLQQWPTIIPQSNSLRSHFFPDLWLGLNKHWNFKKSLHVVIADKLFALINRYTHVPNKVATYTTGILCLRVEVFSFFFYMKVTSLKLFSIASLLIWHFFEIPFILVFYYFTDVPNSNFLC